MCDGAEEPIAADIGARQRHGHRFAGGERQVHVLQAGRRGETGIAEIAFLGDDFSIDFVA